MNRLIDANKMPHLLFYGPPGTGKTSTILAAARRLYGPNYGSMTLEVCGLEFLFLDPGLIFAALLHACSSMHPTIEVSMLFATKLKSLPELKSFSGSWRKFFALNSYITLVGYRTFVVLFVMLVLGPRCVLAPA